MLHDTAVNEDFPQSCPYTAQQLFWSPSVGSPGTQSKFSEIRIYVLQDHNLRSLETQSQISGEAMSVLQRYNKETELNLGSSVLPIT